VSPLDSTDRPRGVAVPKARPDIYTVLLGIALTAILIAILLLVLELRRYNWDYKAASARFTVVAAPTERVPAASTYATHRPLARTHFS
jgi:hypothetical protein